MLRRFWVSSPEAVCAKVSVVTDAVGDGSRCVAGTCSLWGLVGVWENGAFHLR